MKTPAFLTKCRQRLSSFRRNDKGQVAIIMAFAFVPMLAFTGSAIDYSRGSAALAQMNAAADAAALNAVARGRASPTHTLPSDTEIRNFFNAAAGSNTTVTITSFTVTPTNSATTLYVQIDYTATVKTVFMGVLGVQTINFSGLAKAATDLPPYVDFHLLLDNSPSMGVAGSTADISKMVSLTPDSCAFACHQKDSSGNDVSWDYYHLAKNNGVKMRMDLLRDAVKNLMDTAKASTTIPNQFRMAIHTFSDTFQTVAGLSSDLTTQKANASAIDVAYAYYDQNDMQTSYDTAMPAVNSLIAAPGNGMSVGQEQKYLFIVTDGVEDERKSARTGNAADKNTRIIDTLDTTWCDTIKARKISIAVLYTPYLPLPTNGFYNSYVAPLDNTGSAGIVPRLTACASPGFFFQISTSLSIDQAMQAMFQQAVKYARLTK